MRERLVAAFVGSTLLVLVLFGVPRAYQLGDLVQAQEVHEVERAADLAAVVVQGKVADDQPVTPALLDDLLQRGERLEYTAADGTTVTSAEDAEDAEEAATPEDPEDLRTTRELPGGGSITLERSAGMVQDRVSEALLPLVVVVLALLALSVVTGVILARRLAWPFQRLAVAARRLGTGEPVIDVPHSRIPEAEAIGEAIRTSAAQLEELRQHERELAVHASHELRTPVTALRLELEDLALWPQTDPAVAAQLQASVVELDRLSTAISQLLDRSRDQRSHAAEDVDLDALIRLAASGGAAGRQEGRAGVRHVAGGVGTVHADRVTLQRLVTTLLDRAGEASDATVVVLTLDAGSHVEIQVAGRSLEESVGDRLLRDPQLQELTGALGGQLTLLPREGDRDGLVVRLMRKIGRIPQRCDTQTCRTRHAFGHARPGMWRNRRRHRRVRRPRRARRA